MAARAVHLQPGADRLLEAEALRRVVEPDQLAATLVREQVPDEGRHVRSMNEALAAVTTVRDALPPIDGAAAARDELERRATPE